MSQHIGDYSIHRSAGAKGPPYRNGDFNDCDWFPRSDWGVTR